MNVAQTEAVAVDGPAGEQHPLSRVQTDLFCGDCGENLYARPIWRTEDTGLLVARCPRCGKVHPAVEALPYRRVWRARLGVTLGLAWVGLLLTAAAIGLTVDYALQLEAPRWDYQKTEASPYLQPTLNWPRTLGQFRWLLPLAGGLCVGFGVLLASALYHWRARWHVLAAAALPFAGLLIAWLEWRDRRFYMDWSEDPLRDMLLIAAIVAAVQAVGGVIGVCIGRPVVRGLLRVLLPNASRKHFAFLWRRDGRQLPLGPH